MPQPLLRRPEPLRALVRLLFRPERLPERAQAPRFHCLLLVQLWFRLPCPGCVFDLRMCWSVWLDSGLFILVGCGLDGVVENNQYKHYTKKHNIAQPFTHPTRISLDSHITGLISAYNCVESSARGASGGSVYSCCAHDSSTPEIEHARLALEPAHECTRA